jgi:hypothetical protein
VKDPKTQVFWSEAPARKPHLAAGKKRGKEGFGRGRTAIGHAQKAGNGSQATPIAKRLNGCEWFVCEVKLMAVTKAACAPSALLHVIVFTNSGCKYVWQPNDKVLTQGIEIDAACSLKGETCG